MLPVEVYQNLERSRAVHDGPTEESSSFTAAAPADFSELRFDFNAEKKRANAENASTAVRPYFLAPDPTLSCRRSPVEPGETFGWPYAWIDTSL